MNAAGGDDVAGEGALREWIDYRFTEAVQVAGALRG